MNIDWTTKEQKAIEELSKKQELTQQQILRQALRLYQGVCFGIFKIESIDKPVGCPNFDFD